jgi:Kef-type K+ transport system membrane component KefB
LVPAPAWAAGPEGLSRSGPVLFALAVLVAAAKAGGLVAERWKQPAVLGELLVGIGLANLVPLLLGEHGVSFIRADLTLLVLAQVGVLILLFDVGLEADLRALARVGLTSLLVATTGVVVPFLLGWATAWWLLPASPALVHIFVGATLTATSLDFHGRG